MSKNLKRTKLIATLGPASSNRETMIELIKAGVDAKLIKILGIP